MTNTAPKAENPVYVTIDGTDTKAIGFLSRQFNDVSGITAVLFGSLYVLALRFHYDANFLSALLSPLIPATLGLAFSRTSDAAIRGSIKNKFRKMASVYQYAVDNTMKSALLAQDLPHLIPQLKMIRSQSASTILYTLVAGALCAEGLFSGRTPEGIATNSLIIGMLLGPSFMQQISRITRINRLLKDKATLRLY